MTIEQKLVELLLKKDLTIACAESCTGGMLASTIINVPCASKVLGCSVITYSNKAKEQYLHIPCKEIEAFGVVSEQIARQMAKNIANETGADVGVATTGLAGPAGAIDGPPVGTVCFSFFVKGKIHSETRVFSDMSRNEVRTASVNFALKKLVQLLKDDVLIGKRHTVGILGGSFDPPHLAHLSIARALLKDSVDEIWFVPVFSHAFAKNIAAPFEDRLAMLKALVGSDTKMIVSDVELQLFKRNSERSFSYNTLCFLHKRYPAYQFKWVIGSDMLSGFKKWHCYTKILKEFGVIVYHRAGCYTEPLLRGMKFVNDSSIPDISSNEIRKMLSCKKEIVYLTGKEVAMYIKQHNLYI